MSGRTGWPLTFITSDAGYFTALAALLGAGFAVAPAVFWSPWWWVLIVLAAGYFYLWLVVCWRRDNPG